MIKIRTDGGFKCIKHDRNYAHHSQTSHLLCYVLVWFGRDQTGYGLSQ